MVLVMQRKTSISTTGSSQIDSSDEDMHHSSPRFPCHGDAAESWCPKCESLYQSYQETARKSGFTLVGKLYSKKLAFKCLAKGHLSKIRDCSKRLPQAIINCADCRKEAREAVKR